MTFIMPEVPSGVHPWQPAEADFEAKIRPLVATHLDLAERCVRVGSDLLARAQGRKDPTIYQVHATLLVRTLQDLRGCVLCCLSGYPMQGWTVATSTFEAAHTLGFIGDSVDRANEWLSHANDSKPFIPAFDALTNTIIYLGVEPDSAKRAALVQESFALYRHLCMAKHANPIAERSRYIYLVEGTPNLLLTPPFTERRAAEVRLGLLLALRSAQIALWAFDVTHLADPGFVDSRIGDLAVELGSLAQVVPRDIALARDNDHA
jgi:hypothetical protein